MPVYSYKCNICGRVEEKFLPVARRNEEFDCNKLDTSFQPSNINLIKVLEENDCPKIPITLVCKGKMIFQPMQRTNFYFNTKGKQYKS